MPPPLPAGMSALQAIMAAQADLGRDLGAVQWAAHTVSPTVTLNAVSALDNNHVWAVGSGCTILFSGDGVTWSQDTHTPGGCSANLKGVFVQDANDAWAVGTGGTVLICSAHCNQANAVWSLLTGGSLTFTSGGDGQLNNGSTTATSKSLFGPGTNYQNYAISDSQHFIHAGATIASENASLHQATLSATATGTTTKDTFTVSTPAPLPSNTFSFTSVWAADPNDVYAVGTTSGGAGQIWACSSTCSGVVSGNAAGNATWTNVTLGGGLSGTSLNGVTGAGAGLTIVVGSGGAVLICSNNCAVTGATYTALSGTSIGAVTFTGVVAADGNHVYAVGNKGSGGQIWACSNSCNQPVAGGGKGQSTWANVTPPGVGATTLAAVADPGGNTAWAVGSGGAIWYCPSSCTSASTFWVATPVPGVTVSLNGATASDQNHAWIVGAGSTILNLTNNGPTISALTQAITDLGTALTPSLWTNADGNHVDSKKGNQVFDGASDALTQLMGIKGSLLVTAKTDIDLLDGATRLLAVTAMQDNGCNAQHPEELTDAQQELTNGDTSYSQGKYDDAANHYKNAWQQALTAVGTTCAGLNVTEIAFNQTNVVPGDAPTEPASVQVTGTGGTVTFSESGSNFTLCSGCPAGVGTGDLAHELTLTLLDATTSHTYGPWALDSIPSTQICGSGGGPCAAWAAAETHSFTLTVTFPSNGGNAFQGTGATATFVWTRS